MNNIFIEKPVISLSLAVLIIVLGIFSIFKLPINLFPQLEIPLINIDVSYPGADSTLMQNFVTTPIENSLNGIDNLDYITSDTKMGFAQIKLHMQIGTSSDMALMQVMQKLAAIRSDLPKEIEDPRIYKDTSDDNPGFLLAFTTPGANRALMGDYLRRLVQPQIEMLPGVMSAAVLGNELAMRIAVRNDLLSAFNLTPQDIVNSLDQQNVQAPGGELVGHRVNYTLQNYSNLQSPAEFNQIIVKSLPQGQVYLHDIGLAHIDVLNNKITALYNNQKTAMVFVRFFPWANAWNVANEVQRLLPTIRANLPWGMSLHAVINCADYIKNSFFEIIKTFFITIILVFLVVWVFLGSWRASLIPLTTIPLSILGISFVVYLLNGSINLLTLLAIILAMGLVVDDAIVLVENITRHIKHNHSIVLASIAGSREMRVPIISITLTLAAVFVPLAFSSGITGKLFFEFGLTLAGAVIISGLLALTLSPLMCAHLLTAEENYLFKKILIALDGLQKYYQRVLQILIKQRKWVCWVWILSLGMLIQCYLSVPSELMPPEDQGFLQVLARAPEYTDTEYLKKYGPLFDKIFKTIPAITSYLFLQGIPSEHEMLSFIRLEDWSQRKTNIQQLQLTLQDQLNSIPGLDAVVINPSVLPGMESEAVQLVLTCSNNYPLLYKSAQQMLQIARQSGLFSFIKSDLYYNQPSLEINFYRLLMAALKIPLSEVTQSLSLLLSQSKLQYFSREEQSYPVILEGDHIANADPSWLNDISIRNKAGNLIPLTDLIALKTKVIPSSLHQFQKIDAVTLSGNMAAGYSLSQGLNFLNEQAKINLPHSVHYDFSGPSRAYWQEKAHWLSLFMAALTVIFITLAIQFDNFTDPLIVLLGSIPLSLLGSFLPLKLGWVTLNIYTEIGLLTVLGLVSKQGILIVQFARQLIKTGMETNAAIIQASLMRLKPILMTTCAMLGGAFPLMLASGPSSASRFSIGVVIESGMLIGTFFTLGMVPVLCVIFSKKGGECV